MLTSSKPLILVIIMLFSTTSLFGYLSYDFYAKKEKAEQSLALAKNVAKALEKALEKTETKCEIEHGITVDFQNEKKQADAAKDKDLDAIDSIKSNKKRQSGAAQPSNPQQGVESGVKYESNETDVVDIDGRLPDDLNRLLKQTYDRVQGQGGTNP